MRKITKESVEAFINNEKYMNQNMVAKIGRLYLHYNLIAIKKESGIHISNSGWETATTKERLNGVLSLCGKSTIFAKNGVWYYKDINGDKKEFPIDTFIDIDDFQVIQ